MTCLIEYRFRQSEGTQFHPYPQTKKWNAFYFSLKITTSVGEQEFVKSFENEKKMWNKLIQEMWRCRSGTL